MNLVDAKGILWKPSKDCVGNAKRRPYLGRDSNFCLKCAWLESPDVPWNMLEVMCCTASLGLFLIPYYRGQVKRLLPAVQVRQSCVCQGTTGQ